MSVWLCGRRISLRIFDHIMGLDLTFHLRKKTGEVTRVVDRGTNAMQNILSTIMFNVLPQAGAAKRGLVHSEMQPCVQQVRRRRCGINSDGVWALLWLLADVRCAGGGYVPGTGSRADYR
jgi:hypothetical protein